MKVINMKKPKEDKSKKKTKQEALLDRVNQVYDTGKTLGILMGLVDGIKDFINTHQKEHRTARIITWIQTLIVIVCFAYLKWGI